MSIDRWRAQLNESAWHQSFFFIIILKCDNGSFLTTTFVSTLLLDSFRWCARENRKLCVLIKINVQYGSCVQSEKNDVRPWSSQPARKKNYLHAGISHCFKNKHDALAYIMNHCEMVRLLNWLTFFSPLPRYTLKKNVICNAHVYIRFWLSDLWNIKPCSESEPKPVRVLNLCKKNNFGEMSKSSIRIVFTTETLTGVYSST